MVLHDSMRLVFPPDISSERIVGGKDADEGAAPFQCKIGTLFSNNWSINR